MIKTLLWDFDGTMFDTYPHTVNLYQNILVENGIAEAAGEESRAFLMENAKVFISRMREACRERFGYNDALNAVINDEFNRREPIAHPSVSQPYPFALDICRALKERGGMNILYTHRGLEARNYLEYYEFMPYFDELVTAENGFPLKPAPDAIRYVVDKYSLNPDETMMVGDRDIDILAGTNAGIKTCFFKTYDKSADADATLKVFSLETLYGELFNN